MQQSRSTAVRVLIHLALIGWLIYSVTPFVMSVVTSFQVTRDATARDPRPIPDVLVNNSLLIAVVLAAVIIGTFLLLRSRDGDSKIARVRMPKDAARSKGGA